MLNRKQPAYPVVYEHDDAKSEQPGLSKEEYARIELAKAILASDKKVAPEDFDVLDRHVRLLARMLLIEDVG